MTRRTNTRLATGLVGLLAAVAAPGAVDLQAQCTPPLERLIAERKYDEARADLQSQLQRKANDDAAMECIGRALLAEGDSGQAVDWLEKAIRSNGQSAQHHLWLGNALRAETEEASKLRQPFLARRMKGEYEQAVALDPTLVEARHWLVMFYANAPGMVGGSLDKAREQAAAILKLDPMRGHVDAALVAERENDYAGAEKELRTAIAVMLDSAVPYEALGSFYRRRQRWTDAIATYEQLLKAKPDAVNAHLSLGRVFINNLREYDRGEREVGLWLANPPKDAPPMNVSNAHYCLGVAHEQRGRRDQARAEYQIAVTANPKNADAKKALAALK